MMPQTIPWWAWTMPLWPMTLMMTFVFIVGWSQRRSTGSYPTLAECCRALILLHRCWDSPWSGWLRKTDRPADLPQQADQVEPLNTNRQETAAPSATPLT